MRTRFAKFFFVLTVIAAALTPAGLHAQDQDLVPAVELTTRRGTPNFIAKLKAGDDVRVGYLGGSITAAPGWRVKSLKWFQQQYPTAKVSEINAAIGGTGSGLGVFRANQDVISKKPDLLFVEFAVNDGGTSPEKIQCAMEGIVRQTWRGNPETDICFVYTLSEPMLKNLQDGKFQRSASAMEAVANHYGIPSIHFGVEVAKLVTEGKLLFKGEKPAGNATGNPMIFSTDGVHPLVETGHEIYQQVLVRSFQSMQANGTPGPHRLDAMAPLKADNWENAKIVPITPSMLKGKWTKLDPTQPGRAKDFSNRMPNLWKAEEPGASIEFTVVGSQALIYDLVGPDGGELEIKIGDQAPRKAVRFDQHCTYHRLANLDLISSPTPKRQSVKVTLTDGVPDKAKILSETNCLTMEKNAEPYQNNVWHAGAILVIGEIAP